ncbi:RtcB family protein [Jonesiaceae bacterium BS-20]|uniref:3'-phosphate/5'-hydroxy nucleic acid ligase n=1 Tax=Jonesiaceae bacterium BS-20 TaxID=3120821 RepID=A0AAU7DWL6_9MICO
MNTKFPVALTGARASTLMWANVADIDPKAIDQLYNIARLPWVRGLRVMPDVHFGLGATVGSVIAMKDAVSPSAVGVDIGCGMIGIRTSLTASDLPDDLGKLRSKIERSIPVGFKSHKQQVTTDRLPTLVGTQPFAGSEDQFWNRFGSLHQSVQKLEGRARNQLGTLGGGNHFIEVCLDQDDRVWLQLHSGSRNLGKELAEWYICAAKGLDHNLDLPDRDLAVFLGGTPLMDSYLADIEWVQEYAARSRDVMMRLMVNQVVRAFPSKEITFDPAVNVHHNYVTTEIIDGEELIVTRKGAIRAAKGGLGLIPGSMGTGSYIVRGLGNPDSFYSASHGAGRVMSRNQAKKRFTVADLEAQTQGVECRKDAGVLDEIPGAYKDLESVIAAQSDLVEVVARLRTILCVKG